MKYSAILKSTTIINLDRKDKYEDGHIPGAVRYKPEGTLGYTDEMASIPADKPVVVYWRNRSQFRICYGLSASFWL